MYNFAENTEVKNLNEEYVKEIRKRINIKKWKKMEKLNEKLNELYSSKWEGIQSELNRIVNDDTLPIKPTNPLLIYLNEEDLNMADVRVMFFGQETNSWQLGNEILTDDIDMLLKDQYDAFFNHNGCFSYGGQFWNGISKFKQMIAEQLPNKKFSYVWNNIIKIGKHDGNGCPPDYIYEIERKHFSVVQQEIDIIKPHIILFFTGPNYDNKIADNFENLSYSAISSFTERELAKISFPNVENVFRTYHPNFLWRNDIERYFNAIINEIELTKM
jgi:hypothetical protein